MGQLHSACTRCGGIAPDIATDIAPDIAPDIEAVIGNGVDDHPGGLPSLGYEDVFVPGMSTKTREEGCLTRAVASSVDTCGEVLDADFIDASPLPVSPVDGDDPPRSRPNSRRLTRLAAGHGGTSILKEFQNDEEELTGIPEYIIKVYDKSEAFNYGTLQGKPDPLQRFTAHYGGDVWKSQTELTKGDEELDPVTVKGDAKQVQYMRLANLLRKFTRGPHVMDCKIGLRSFAESEAQANQKVRPDLYERMVDLDPSAPTEEEHAQKACTKHRWMTFNDALTKLPDLGLRVDGIAHSGECGSVEKKELKKATSVPQLAGVIIKNFLPNSLGEEVAPDPAVLQYRKMAVTQEILADLKDLQNATGESNFVRTHEFVGCSLLFVADKCGPCGGVFLIDFAKVSPLPEGVFIDHRSSWTPGNHEDGLFIGIGTAIATWEEVLSRLRRGELTPEQ